MDPAVAALDLTKAGAIIANMIESYLAGGAPDLPWRQLIVASPSRCWIASRDGRQSPTDDGHKGRT
jgi:hypothetical protein